MALPIHESVLGSYITAYAGKDRYPVTIVFMHRPAVLICDSLVFIDQPERFGSWGTSKEKRAYVEAFIGAWDARKAEWDAIPCSECGQPGDPCACEEEA